MAPAAGGVSSKLFLFISIFDEISLLIVLYFLRALGKSVGLSSE